MPTNLPPDYFNVERRFREATDPGEKITLLEEMYSLVPKHKGTDHLRADLRRQLSKLKTEAQEHKKHAGHIPDYHIEKEGAGQVVLIGPPNTGKSTLVAALTNANPEISEAAFTTRKPIPGMMLVKDIQVQLVDTPSLDFQLSEGGLFSLIRQADLILLVVDLQTDPLEQLIDSLKLLAHHHIAPLESYEAYSITDRMAFKKMVLLVNKCDDESVDEDYELCCDLIKEQEFASIYQKLHRIPVSAANKRNFEQFKQVVFDSLEIIRVYAKPPGKEPDMERPFVMQEGSTVAELARKVHRDFYEKLKSARVWGSSEFAGQMVSKEYILQDKDIVELRI